MERSSLPRIVKYFYVNPCVIRLIFNALQWMVFCPAISLELALKVMWIGRRYHVVLVYLIK